MKRSWLALLSALALALVALGAIGLSGYAQEEEENLGVYPTIVYVPPNTMLGAEFELGPFTVPVLYGANALWVSFESAPEGKFWSVGFWLLGLSPGPPTFDMTIGLGYSWYGWLKAEGFFTASGNYGLAVGFTLTLW